MEEAALVPMRRPRVEIGVAGLEEAAAALSLSSAEAAIPSGTEYALEVGLDFGLCDDRADGTTDTGAEAACDAPGTRDAGCEGGGRLPTLGGTRSRWLLLVDVLRRW